ncbi:MAG: filamentous hemagglutinin N-terminal domain-containing protein [Microcoleaceae cyanobacterium]
MLTPNSVVSLTARLSTISFVSTFILSGLPAQSQIIPDNSLGSENSIVVPNQSIHGINSDRIDGGAIRGSNLFHSFQEFNIDNGRCAYFSNPETISNILTRVTGSNISNIFGTLGVLGNANLFLINPNGIVFGPNARLDVGGSFFSSTADSILFENSVEFAASNPDAPPLLTINIPIRLNFRENPGTIVNQSIGSLSFPTNIQRADIILINGAIAGVVSNPGGSIAINARNLEISSGSRVVSGVLNDSSLINIEDGENLDTQSLQAGDITINATESIRLTDQNSAIRNKVFSALVDM